MRSLSLSGPANLFDNHPIAPLEAGYTEIQPDSHGQKCAYKMNVGGDRPLPEEGLDEHWRQVYVDMSVPNTPIDEDPEYVSELAAWLVRNQPISLAVNGSDQVNTHLLDPTRLIQSC